MGMTPEEFVRILKEILGRDVAPTDPTLGELVNVIVGDMSNIKNPVGADPDELKQIGLARKAVLDKLNTKGWTQGVLAEVRTLLLKVQTEVDRVTQAITNRAERRKKLLATFRAVGDPKGAIDSEIAALELARKAVRGALAVSPLKESDLLTAQDELLKLQKLASDTKDLANARSAYATRLAKSVGPVKAADTMLDTESRAYLMGLIKAVATTASQAKTVSDYTSLSGELDKVDQALAAALKFIAERDVMTRGAVVYIKLEGGGSKATLETARDKALTDAGALAKVGKFVLATAKLADFRSSLGGPDQTKFDDADKYVKALRKFGADSEPILKDIKKARRAPGWNMLDKDYSDARKKGARDKLYGDAVTLLTNLATQLGHMRDYAEQLDRVEALKADPRRYTGGDVNLIDTALSTADGEAKGKKWAKGAATLAKLIAKKAVFGESANYSVELAKTKKSYDMFQKEHGSTAAGVYIKGLYTGAGLDAGNEQYVDALDKLSKVRALLPDASEYLELVAAAEKRIDTLDGSRKTVLLKPAKDKAAVNQYGHGVTLLRGLGPMLESLAEFVARRAQVDKAHKAIPSGETERAAGLKTILDAADLLAADPGKLDKATAKLDEIKRMDAYAALDGQVMEYEALVAPLERRYTKLKPRVKPSQAEAKLTKLWGEARDPVVANRDYATAIPLLKTFDGTLEEAEKFVNAREAAFSVVRSLEEIATKFSADTIIYTPLSKVEVGKRKDAAEKKAIAADFAQAATAFKKLLTETRAMSVAAAKLLDSNTHSRGHSMARHGPPPGIDDSKLVKRVKTGVAPDGHMSKTQSASQFDDPASWLEVREAALREAVAKHGYNPAATEMAYTDKLNLKIPKEHPKPIDTSFVGLKERPDIDVGKGRMGGDKTYESWDRYEGLTRTITIFAFILFDPKELYENSNKVPDTLFRPKAWKKQHNGKTYNTKTIGKYVGEWVLLTQYPITDGWDPETKTYTKPL